MVLDTYQDLYIVQMNDVAWNSIQCSIYPKEVRKCPCGTRSTSSAIGHVRTSTGGPYLINRIYTTCGHVGNIGQPRAIVAPDVLTRLMLELP